MGLHAENDPGLNFRWNYTLSPQGIQLLMIPLSKTTWGARKEIPFGPHITRCGEMFANLLDIGNVGKCLIFL